MTANFPTGVHILEEIRLFSCFKIGQIQLRRKQLYLLQQNSVFWEVSVFFPGKLLLLLFLVMVLFLLILYGSPTILCNIREKNQPLPQRRLIPGRKEQSKEKKGKERGKLQFPHRITCIGLTVSFQSSSNFPPLPLKFKKEMFFDGTHLHLKAPQCQCSMPGFQMHSQAAN